MQRASSHRSRRGFRALASLAAAAALCGIMSTSSFADPLPGEVMKFNQLPIDAMPVNGQLYWGHDELSTASRTATAASYNGIFMADDFSDRVSQPVVHISWWGSYLQNQHFNGVKKFLVSFESDVPQGPNNPFSHPGVPLLNQIVSLGPLAPGSGTYTEQLVSPGGAPLNEQLYKYNAELRLPFPEQANTVYWLKIAALIDAPTDGQIQWGWHDRDYTISDPLAAGPPLVNPGERNEAPAGNPFPVWHFQDDAVNGNLVTLIDPATGNVTVDQSNYAPQNYIAGVDGPGIVGDLSKDLAFQLYYRDVPEPAGTLGLAAMGALMTLRKRPRR
jgi:hypothetical protein